MSINLTRQFPTRPPRGGADLVAWLTQLWRAVRELPSAINDAFDVRTLVWSYHVTCPAANFSGRPIFRCSVPVLVTGAWILTEGAAGGVDDANTAIFTLTDGDGRIIASKTYNTATQPPASGADSLGNVGPAELLEAGELLKFSMTLGATASMSPYQVLVEYQPVNSG